MSLMNTRAAAALLCITLGTVISAQELRGSGGEIELITKSRSAFSGTLGVELPLLSSRGVRTYESSLGGTMLNDRLWFFGSAQRLDASQLAFSFDAAAPAARPPAPSPAFELPSSFLTLRQTATPTDRSVFSISVTR